MLSFESTFNSLFAIFYISFCISFASFAHLTCAQLAQDSGEAEASLCLVGDRLVRTAGSHSGSTGIRLS
jgi:hypothetical protein